MIQSQDERRDFIRMAVESCVEFQRQGSGQRSQGQTRDLSAGGLRFTTAAPVAQGEVLEITVHPGANITPPLEARLTVLRVERDGVRNLYDVAGRLEH